MVHLLSRIKLIFLGVVGLSFITALAGASYQWLASSSDLAATPPPEDSWMSAVTAFTSGAPVRLGWGFLLYFLIPDWVAEPSVGPLLHRR